MPELRVPVNMVWVEYVCDVCATPVLATGVEAQGKTMHYCPKCNRHYLLDKTYPHTEPETPHDAAN